MNQQHDHVPGTHPGVYIVRDILPRIQPMPISRFAAALGMSRNNFYKIIREKDPAPVRTETALRLGQLTNTEPEWWLTVQLQYDLLQTQLELAKELTAIQPLFD